MSPCARGLPCRVQCAVLDHAAILADECRIGAEALVQVDCGSRVPPQPREIAVCLFVVVF